MSESKIVEVSSTDGFYLDYVEDLAVGLGGKIIEKTCPSNFLSPHKIVVSENCLSDEGKKILGINKE